MIAHMKRGASPKAIRHIAENLRGQDKAELFALKWDTDPETIVRHVEPHLTGLTWTWYWGQTPAAVIGMVPNWPGVWTAWAFGTGDWRRVVLGMTKHARRIILPTLADQGAHRVQAFSHAEHHSSQEWMRRCFGFREEATLSGFGRNGEDFRIMVLGLNELETYRGCASISVQA